MNFITWLIAHESLLLGDGGAFKWLAEDEQGKVEVSGPEYVFLSRKHGDPFIPLKILTQLNIKQ